MGLAQGYLSTDPAQVPAASVRHGCRERTQVVPNQGRALQPPWTAPHGYRGQGGEGLEEREVLRLSTYNSEALAEAGAPLQD